MLNIKNVSFIFIICWLYATLSGFQMTYPKESLYLLILMLTSYYVWNANLNTNYLPYVSLVVFCMFFGLLPFLSHPSVIVYFIFGVVNTLMFMIYFKGFNYKYSFLWLICSLFLLITMWKSLGLGLYLWGIQPSITDLFLSIFILNLFYRLNLNKKLILLVMTVIYGLLFESRLVMICIPFVLVLNFFLIKFELTFKFIFSVIYWFVVLFILFFLIDFIPNEIINNPGDLALLDDFIGPEAKRLSLILNGLYVFDNNFWTGVGFGPSVYNDHVKDNPLGIAPQLLPLTLASYGGIFLSLAYSLLFYIWVISEKSSYYLSVKLFLLFFIFFHEYVFNPFFGFCLLIINSGAICKRSH
jgi:hypothetical protein